jgi:membrane protease YdiL (CAAX protease family)
MAIQIFPRAAIVLGDRRILKPGGLRWLRAVAWMVSLVFLIALSFGPAMEGIRALLPKDDPRIGFAVNVAGALIALAAYVLLVRLGEDRLPGELAPAPAPSQLVVGAAIGTAMFACVMAVMAAAGFYRIHWHGLAPAWRPGGLALQAGVIEEILIRGVVLRLLWRAFGPVAAFAISALIFGAAHLANPNASIFAALCIALEAGVMLGAFYALTGRLWMSIGVHAAWNFAQGYLFGAAVSGIKAGPALAQSIAQAGAPVWGTGGAFGPEASLPALLVCTSVGVAILWTAYQRGCFAPNEA